MAAENVTFFSDRFPTVTKKNTPSKSETVSWFSDNMETVIKRHKNNYRAFLDSIASADGWQSQESMDGYIEKVRDAKKSDFYGIGSEAYDKLIQSLEGNKAIYAGYESAEDFNANHERNVAYRQQLLNNDPEVLRKEIGDLEQRYHTSLNVDGSRDSYDRMLAEITAQLIEEYTQNNFDNLTEEQIRSLAVNKAKSDPRLQIWGAESGATTREDPNTVKRLLDQKRAELNTTLMLQQEYRLTEEALAAPDFAQKSVYTPSLTVGNDRWDALYREVNTASSGAGTNNVGYMSEAERALFNYHFATGGAVKAEEYLTSIQNALNARKAGEIYENYFENRVLRELRYGFVAGLDSAWTGIKNTFGKKKDFYATNTAQHLSGMISDEMQGKGWLPSLAYSTTTSVGQMAPALLTASLTSHVPVVGAALAPFAGAAVTGTSTYGNAYAEMINNGYSAKQANTYALLSGVSEAGLDMLLGGIDGLRATKQSGALVKLANQLDNGFFRAALVLADGSLDEFSEEALQQLLEPVFKTIATGVDDPALENVDWGQVLYAGILGAVTAGVMNGAPVAVNAATSGIRTAVQGARLQKNGVNVQGLKAMAEALPADTVAHKLADKIAEDAGAYSVAKLFNAVGAELTAQNQADIVNNLTHKGVLTKDAETIAAYLAAAVNGAEFTSRQVKAIENNPLIAEAMRETLMDPQSSVNRRMQNFKETAFSPDTPLETQRETGYTGNRGEINDPYYQGKLGTGARTPQEEIAIRRGTAEVTARTPESFQSFARRAQKASGRDGQGRSSLVKQLRNNIAISYTPSAGLSPRMARVVELFEKHGCTVVVSKGPIESNRDGYTMVHTEGFIDPADLTVYFSDQVESVSLEAVAHELLHIYDLRHSDAYADVEAVVCQEVDYSLEGYEDFADWIEEQYGWIEKKTGLPLREVNEIAFTEKLIHELVAYVHGAITANANADIENTYKPIFKNWSAVVEASRTFNAAIGADYSSIMDNSLPSSDGTGRDSYTQNTENALSEAERQRRIQEIENGDFSGIRRFAAEQQNPQQAAVGVDSRAQNAGALRDSGVEIGVRPAAMDEVFKRMSAKSRKKLYAELEAHTGVKLVEDPTLLADGEYDPATQTIRINPNRATPMTVIKHELTHYLESSKILYQDFMNYAFEKSRAFQEWLDSKGHTLDTMKKELVARYAASGVTLNTERGASAEQEILANFAAEVLFTDLTALRELGQKNRTLFQRLKHFVLGIINKFRGTPAETDLQHLERMFAAAVEETKSTPVEGFGETKKFIDPNFSSAIDAWDQNKTGFRFRVGTVSEPLQSIGVDPKEIYWDSSKIKRILNEHPQMTIDVIKQVPNILEMPIIVMESNTVSGRLTLFGEVYDTTGSPVLAVLELSPKSKNGRDLDIVMIASAYGKEGNLQNYIAKSNILYVDPNKNRTNRWLTVNRLQLPLPSSTTVGSSDPSIAQPPAGVNTYSTQDSTKKFIAPEAIAEMPGDQLTDEELLAQLRKRGMSSTPNPLQTAQLRPEDADTTPPLRRNGPMNERGDGTSAFADSLQNTGIFSNELKQLAAEDENITRYDMITNKETLQQANDLINQGGRAFVEKFSQKDSSSYTALDNAVAWILIGRYSKVGDNQSALALTEKLRKAATAQGQAVQILSLVSRLTPEGMVMYAQKELAQAYEIMVKGQSNRWIEEHKQQFELTDEDVEFIRRRTWQAAQLPKGRDKDIRLAEIASRIQSKIPQEKGQAYKAWQRTAMLLNPKTQVRNILGNITMVPAYMASDLVGSGIDTLISESTGIRTTTAGIRKKAIAGLKQGFFESYDDFLRHINTRDIKADRLEIEKRSLDNFNEHHTGFASEARNKLSRVLNAIDRFNSFLLDAGDRPFYEMWFINSLNGQMAANGVTEPTDDMIEVASLDALQRTLQDPNKMTAAVSKVKEILNYAQIGGYGLGDVFVKFTKTPANLTKAVLEFSPLGLAKALVVDTKRFVTAMRDGKVTPQMQRAYVKNLSNGIVGSLITALAAGLAAAGLVTGEQDEDKDVAAFERAVLGYQPYSFKIGNTSFSYDWMQPIGAHIAMMANYFQEKENAELTGEKLTAYQALTEMFKTGGQVLFDQSFMQSIQQLFADDNVFYNILNAVLNDVNAPVPQLLSQTAAVLDPTVRNTYEYGNDVQTAINKVLYKLPGARQTLAPSVDVLGNDRKQVKNGVGRALSAFVSPMNISVGYDSAAGQEMYRLYEATGDPAAIAPGAPNYVSTADGKRSLSAEQKAEYQRITGQTASVAVESLLGNAAYRKLSDEQKTEVLTSIYAYAKQAANRRVLGLELNEAAAKAQEAVDGGVPIEWYFLIKKTADSDGNFSVSQKEARAILEATDLSREQKAVLWRAFNKSWKNNPYGTYKYY